MITGSGIHWHMTVLSGDESRILFTGRTTDRAELEMCCAEALRLRPGAVVMVRPPFGGAIYRYGGDDGSAGISARGCSPS